MSDNVNNKVAFHTLGCKVNICETEAMMRLLEDRGFQIVEFGEPADLIVINTCSVTNIADKKSRQMIHKARKLCPSARIVVTGCYTDGMEETDCEKLGCDRIISNREKNELLAEAEKTIRHMGTHTRATIKIEDGCNQFCSYCIIPYKRGRVSCRPEESILREAKMLAQAGHREIILTGIHISSYGAKELVQLIRNIARTDGVERIRIGSLEPRIIDQEFLDGLVRIPQLCPHFHLSLQSGCDKTLQAMNRHYTAEEYRQKVRLIRSCYEHPAITTDVIAGFPGETEEDFAQSLAFVDEMQFFEMHIFPYSRREGTRAAGMPGQLTTAQKNARVQRLEEVNARNTALFASYYAGREVELLTEECEDGFVTGHTPEYLRLRVPSDTVKSNELFKCIAKREYLIV